MQQRKIATHAEHKRATCSPQTRSTIRDRCCVDEVASKINERSLGQELGAQAHSLDHC